MNQCLLDLKHNRTKMYFYTLKKQQTTLCSPVIFAGLVLLKWNDFYTLAIGQIKNLHSLSNPQLDYSWEE